MQRRALNVLIRIMESTQRIAPAQLARRMDRELKIGPTAARELVAWVVDNRYLAVCPHTGELCLDLAQEAVVPAGASAQLSRAS